MSRLPRGSLPSEVSGVSGEPDTWKWEEEVGGGETEGEREVAVGM